LGGTSCYPTVNAEEDDIAGLPDDAVRFGNTTLSEEVAKQAESLGA
jgi:hypothetical protein